MYRSTKRALLMGATAACYALSFQSTAQETAEPVPVNESARTLNTVTVTAQRREESIQDVPLSVTAADSETLARLRVDNVENISLLTPSISFRKTNFAASSSNIQIRGIGTAGNARTFEGAVGVFIDGVYRTRSGQALANFLDIDNLQVLRGPQGTLFGKNTAAGALLMTSASPSLDEVEGYVEGSYGNYDAFNLKGAVNLPLTDWAALRVAATHTKQDGYFDDPNGGTLNNIERNGYKASLLLEPSSDLSIKLIADYAKEDDNCCYGTADFFDGPLQGFVDSLSIANGYQLPSDDISDFEATSFPETPNLIEDQGISLQIDFDTGAGTLSSVTGFRRFDVTQDQDVDFSAADLLDLYETFRSRFFSQEFSFNGTMDAPVEANYVIGAYYSDEDLRMARNLFHGSQAQDFWDVVFGAPGLAYAAPGLFSAERFESTSESFALFTHWDFAIAERWNLILGARYSSDNKTGRFENPYFRSMFDPLALAGVVPGLEYDDEFSDEAVTGTISLQYRPNADQMYYVSYNRGYKSGGVNLDVNAAGVPGNYSSPLYDPELIDAYEFGGKIDWAGGAARTNFAFFYNDITDLQVAQFLGLQFAIINSPTAEVFGAEIEQTYAINDYLIAKGSATLLETADFGDDPVLGIADPDRPYLGGMSGRRFSTSPELAANASLELDYPIAPGIALTGLAQVQYTSEVFTNTASNLKQEAVTLLNANAGLSFEDHDLTVSAFIRNATDEVYVTQHFNTPLQDIDRNAYLGDPRTYGVMVRKTF